MAAGAGVGRGVMRAVPVDLSCVVAWVDGAVREFIVFREPMPRKMGSSGTRRTSAARRRHSIEPFADAARVRVGRRACGRRDP